MFDFTVVLSNIQSTGVFLIVLSVLIIVHEWGHFMTAKKLGVRVERFALGFGPELFSRIYHGTKYLICLIPLGGYVKMAGDERQECKGAADEFYSKSPGKRALIVLNGPVVNFILAYVCFVVVFMFGYPDLSNRVGELIPDYPAVQAGIMLDDEITEINGHPVTNWTELQKAVTLTDKDKIQVKILRGQKPVSLIVTPKVERRKNIFGQEKTLRLIGIRPKEEIVLQKNGFFAAVIKAGQKLWEIVALTYKSLFFMITGGMSVKESVTGPIGIFFIIKSASEAGFTHVMFILGVISASLAIFNLLPLFPLDGGHLFFLAIEKIRGKALSEKTDDLIARIGFGFIILLAVFVFYSDFARFGWIDKIMQVFPHP